MRIVAKTRMLERMIGASAAFKKRHPTLGSLLATVTLLCFAGNAEAAKRFAEPGGDGPAGTCPLSNPCDLLTAVEDDSVEDGDVIGVSPGTYNLTTNPGLIIEEAIALVGGGGGRATITGTGGSQTILVDQGLPASVLLRNLTVENTGGGEAVRMFRGELDRVEAYAAGTACRLIGGGDPSVSNSICASLVDGHGIDASPQVGYLGGTFRRLRNVTAIGAGEFAALHAAAQLTDVVVDARNVIAHHPDGPDVSAHALNGGQVELRLSHSAYADVSGGGGDAEITPPGTESNITAPPALDVNYRQISSSPTVDAGDSAAGEGDWDVDGETRVQGGTVDIGADELEVAPTVTIASGPAEGGFTNDPTPDFEFGADEPDVDFGCIYGPAGATIFVPFACSSPLGLSERPDGEYLFVVTATDASSTLGSASRTFTIDTVAPRAAITGGPAEGATIAATTPTFSITVDEPGSNVLCAVDEDPLASCSSAFSHTTRPLADGPRRFRVQATDPAGNTGPPSIRSFTVDTTPDSEPPAGPTPPDAGAPRADGSIPQADVITARGLKILDERTLRIDRRGAAQLRLRCRAGEASPPCRGRVLLRTRARLPLGKGRKARMRRVVLARASFRIPGGRTKAVRLRLGKAKLRLLEGNRRARKAIAIAQVRSGTGKVATVRKRLLAVPRVGKRGG